MRGAAHVVEEFSLVDIVPHKSKRFSHAFSAASRSQARIFTEPRAGDRFEMWGVVGGGGGHTLKVESFALSGDYCNPAGDAEDDMGDEKSDNIAASPQFRAEVPHQVAKRFPLRASSARGLFVTHGLASGSHFAECAKAGVASKPGAAPPLGAYSVVIELRLRSPLRPGSALVLFQPSDDPRGAICLTSDGCIMIGAFSTQRACIITGSWHVIAITAQLTDESKVLAASIVVHVDGFALPALVQKEVTKCAMLGTALLVTGPFALADAAMLVALAPDRRHVSDDIEDDDGDEKFQSGFGSDAPEVDIRYVSILASALSSAVVKALPVPRRTSAHGISHDFASPTFAASSALVAMSPLPNVPPYEPGSWSRVNTGAASAAIEVALQRTACRSIRIAQPLGCNGGSLARLNTYSILIDMVALSLPPDGVRQSILQLSPLNIGASLIYADSLGGARGCHMFVVIVPHLRRAQFDSFR